MIKEYSLQEVCSESFLKNADNVSCQTNTSMNSMMLNIDFEFLYLQFALEELFDLKLVWKCECPFLSIWGKYFSKWWDEDHYTILKWPKPSCFSLFNCRLSEVCRAANKNTRFAIALSINIKYIIQFHSKRPSKTQKTVNNKYLDPSI